MKSVTEFPNVILTQGLKTKTDMTGEGKTPEEISQSLGEKFKYEGDKLKHFNNAIDVAGQHSENLKRVLVISLAEGENAPHKSTKVEEHHYVPDFFVATKQVPMKKSDDKGGRGKGRGGGGGKGGQHKGPKESPWGLSEEQKIEKKKAQAAAAVAARAGKT